MEKFKYYEIDNRRFKVEQITDDLCEVIIFEGENFVGSYCFEGKDARAEALAEILSYSEINEDEYNS